MFVFCHIFSSFFFFFSFSCRGVREDIEQEDDQESYFRYMEENPTAGLVKDDDDVEMEYDAEGNAIIPEKMKVSFALSTYGQKLLLTNTFII